MRHDMLVHSLKFERTCHCDKWWLTKEASKAKVNETWVYANITSQIGKLAYEIEFRIQIDKEDFIHDINQYEFKVDG